MGKVLCSCMTKKIFRIPSPTMQAYHVVLPSTHKLCLYTLKHVSFTQCFMHVMSYIFKHARLISLFQSRIRWQSTKSQPVQLAFIHIFTKKFSYNQSSKKSLQLRWPIFYLQRSSQMMILPFLYCQYIKFLLFDTHLENKETIYYCTSLNRGSWLALDM